MTAKIRRSFIDSLAEGLAPMPDARFSRVARAIAYLSRRMERAA